MLDKSKRRAVISRELKVFLNQFSYTVQKKTEGDFVICDNKITVNRILIDYYSDGLTCFGRPEIVFYPIEHSLLYLTKKEVYEHCSTLMLNFDLFSETFKSTQRTVKTEQDVIRITDAFKKAFVELYVPAFEKYSDPKNVLELWDSLGSVEEKNLFFPGPDKYAKILFFSKMVGDSAFEHRAQESINIYEERVKENVAYTQYLELCQKVIDYLRNNEI